MHRSSAWVCDGPIVQAIVGTAWGQVAQFAVAVVDIAVLQYAGKKKVPPGQEPKVWKPEKCPQEMVRVEQVKK